MCWGGWIGYLRPDQFLDHLTVITNIFKIKITHDLPLLAGGPVVGGPPFCTNACSITGVLALNKNLDFEY